MFGRRLDSLGTSQSGTIYSGLSTIAYEGTMQIHENGRSLATVRGVTLNEFPSDLYVPPEALRVFLDSFEGPLDLLLYLIRKHDFDILEISVSGCH